ncbi:MAG: diguanylate cyclase domain-containing protein [Terracidiphilus sp.]
MRALGHERDAGNHFGTNFPTPFVFAMRGARRQWNNSENSERFWRHSIKLEKTSPEAEPPRNSPFTSGPEFYKEILDHLGDGVYFVDRERRILYWNEGAFRLTGYKPEEMVGQHCGDNTLCHVDPAGNHLCLSRCPLSVCMAAGEAREAHLFLRHKMGRRVPVAVRVQPVRDADGIIVGAVEIFSDDSARIEAQRRTESMERLAFLDHLTQVPNRRFLELCLHTALCEYAVHRDPFGLLLFDIDDFKEINDLLGHVAGDRALQEVAKTLTGALRPSDNVGRWGGDEFLAVVRNVNETNLKEMAKRCAVLVSKTRLPGKKEESFTPLSVSVGDALIQPGMTVEELIQRVDERMYGSKGKGKGV